MSVLLSLVQKRAEGSTVARMGGGRIQKRRSSWARAPQVLLNADPAGRQEGLGLLGTSRVPDPGQQTLSWGCSRVGQAQSSREAGGPQVIMTERLLGALPSCSSGSEGAGQTKRK